MDALQESVRQSLLQKEFLVIKMGWKVPWILICASTYYIQSICNSCTAKLNGTSLWMILVDG